MKIHRVRSNGERYTPAQNKEGFYVLGDPAAGSQKHLAQNSVFVKTLEEAASLIQNSGFSLRMVGEDSGQVNLISPSQIRIE